jgi:hypothetical protein
MRASGYLIGTVERHFCIYLSIISDPSPIFSHDLLCSLWKYGSDEIFSYFLATFHNYLGAF